MRLGHYNLYHWFWTTKRGKYELSWDLSLKCSCRCDPWDGEIRFLKDNIFRGGIRSLSFISNLVWYEFIGTFKGLPLLWKTLRREQFSFIFRFKVYHKQFFRLSPFMSNLNDWQRPKDPIPIFYNSTTSKKAASKWN